MYHMSEIQKKEKKKKKMCKFFDSGYTAYDWSKEHHLLCSPVSFIIIISAWSSTFLLLK